MLRLIDEEVPYKPPAPEEVEVFLAEPSHILARVIRDLFQDDDSAKATLAVRVLF